MQIRFARGMQCKKTGRNASLRPVFVEYLQILLGAILVNVHLTSLLFLLLLRVLGLFACIVHCPVFVFLAHAAKPSFLLGLGIVFPVKGDFIQKIY